jgi:hypothetical protein
VEVVAAVAPVGEVAVGVV